MPDNSFSELFRGEITPTELARETGLAYPTCFKVLYDPKAHVRPETARIFRDWVVDYLNLKGCELDELFYSNNLVATGPFPQNGESLHSKGRTTICHACRMETRISETCVQCGADLKVQTG